MKISITSNYGFDHNWTLTCFGRSFYLGQDVKFCSRVLGMEPSSVVNAIGTNRVDTPKGSEKLAKFICKKLGITKSNVNKLESWDLCAQ